MVVGMPRQSFCIQGTRNLIDFQKLIKKKVTKKQYNAWTYAIEKQNGLKFRLIIKNMPVINSQTQSLGMSTVTKNSVFS